MAEYTAKPSLLTEYLINLAKTKASELGLVAVYYCDQEYIPEVPALCIEPAQVVRELDGAPMRTTNEFLVSALMYCANVEGVENAQHDADLMAEAVADMFNQDGVAPGAASPDGTRFGGLVIYGYVQSSEYGYVVKSSKLMRANRMLIYAKSRTNLLEA
jgi:hypothetical protein